VVLETPPELSAVFTATGLQLTLDGEPDREYVVESSTDLKTWTEVGTFKNPTGNTSINQAVATGSDTRFFRARGKSQ
jgi:hypothetical protein